jgi:hypothetical protein
MGNLLKVFIQAFLKGLTHGIIFGVAFLATLMVVDVLTEKPYYHTTQALLKKLG